MSVVSGRLRRLRAELDEVGEQLERLATATEPIRLTNDAQLVGSHEVEALTGVTRSTLRNWKRGGKLPTPIAELRCGTIWLRADIEKWLRSQ